MSKPIDGRPLKRALLTGAASGIGKACASVLSSRGVAITALDVVEPDYEIEHYHRLDLDRSESIETAITAVSKMSAFDALFNIAGVPPKPGQAERVLNINLLGQIKLTDGIVGQIAPGGAIVNMASRAGHQWKENLDQIRRVLALQTPAELQDFVDSSGIDATRAYNLSKEAMIVWTMVSTQALRAVELRMNSVSPAAIDTAILDDFKTAFGPAVDKNLGRVGRPGKPEEVAEVAVFLASPESYWLQGIDLVVDGGMGAMIASEALNLNA